MEKCAYKGALSHLERQQLPSRWMERFNGVARKSLNNYLAWIQVLEIHHQ
jgi:transposase-like protein